MSILCPRVFWLRQTSSKLPSSEKKTTKTMQFFVSHLLQSGKHLLTRYRRTFRSFNKDEQIPNWLHYVQWITNLAAAEAPVVVVTVRDKILPLIKPLKNWLPLCFHIFRFFRFFRGPFLKTYFIIIYSQVTLNYNIFPVYVEIYFTIWPLKLHQTTAFLLPSAATIAICYN